MNAVVSSFARVGAAGLCFLVSIAAHADDIAPSQGAVEPTQRHLTWQTVPGSAADQTPSRESSSAPRHAEERPFAFLLDPSTPSAGDIGVAYDLGAASSGSADRPLPSSIGLAGIAHSFTVDYGWGDHVAPFVSVRAVQPAGTPIEGGFDASAGARWQLTDPKGRAHFTLAAAGFREVGGSFGGYARFAGSYDWERLRVAGNVHAERVFAAGRDSVDILLLAGISYRVMNEMRVGVEYVGQDVEEAFGDEEAEGGPRQYVGPSLALNLISDRLQLVGGAGVGIPHRTGVIGRLATLVTF